MWARFWAYSLKKDFTIALGNSTGMTLIMFTLKPVLSNAKNPLCHWPGCLPVGKYEKQSDKAGVELYLPHPLIKGAEVNWFS